MLFSISHRTKLNYSDPISESVMEVRAMPRTDERQVLRWFDIEATPSAKACQYIDWLGNAVHQFALHEIHRQVIMTSKCVVETRPMSTSLRELRAPLEELVRDHRSWDYLHSHGPANDDPSIAAIATQMGLATVRNIGEAIDVVTTRARDFLTYRPGVTRSTSSVTEVLKLGAGVCQDFTHVSLALLRHVGVPCRYVSGYLYRPGAVELQTHAWTEVFVPNVGWLAFDTALSELAGEHYVTVAVGRSYADVPPNRGIFRGESEERIEVSVVMRPIDIPARLTPYSTGSELFTAKSASHVSAIRSRRAKAQEPPLAKTSAALELAQRLQQPQ
jgi:transglutaminase-like putative cysteine protease